MLRREPFIVFSHGGSELCAVSVAGCEGAAEIRATRELLAAEHGLGAADITAEVEPATVQDLFPGLVRYDAESRAVYVAGLPVTAWLDGWGWDTAPADDHPSRAARDAVVRYFRSRPYADDPPGEEVALGVSRALCGEAALRAWYKGYKKSPDEERRDYRLFVAQMARGGLPAHL